MYSLGGARRESKLAICPGSFDPITNGHLDMIRRGSKIFDEVIIAIFNNQSKTTLISVEERIELSKEATKDSSNGKVDVSEGLLVDYAKEQQAHAIVRGLRAVSDFEYEMQITSMNKRLEPHVETSLM